MTGIVKYWNPEKSFGFITRDDGVDIFFHITRILVEHRAQVAAGARVSFEIAPPIKLGKSVQAVDIKVTQAVAPEDIESFYGAFVEGAK